MVALFTNVQIKKRMITIIKILFLVSCVSHFALSPVTAWFSTYY